MRDTVSTGHNNSFKGKDNESSDDDDVENGSNNSDAESEEGSDQEAEVSGEDEKSEDDVSSDGEEDSEGEGESDEEVGASSSKSVPLENPFFNGESEDNDESMDNDSDNETADTEINSMLTNRKQAQLAGKRKAESKETQSANKKKAAANDSSDDSESDFDDNGSEAEGEVQKESFPEGDEEEDELIKALRSSRENAVRPCPPPIKIKNSVTDISFHPEEDIIAVSNISGELAFFRYSNEENKIERKMKLHKSSIRCIEYSEEGDKIYSGGLDKYIKVLNVETGDVEEGNYKHPSSLYSLCAMQQGAASGDEDGTVKLWDFRMKKSTKTSKRFEDFVSSICYQEDRQRLIASSGEGTIQTWDLRMNCVEMQSEVYESELNCVAVVKDDHKLAVGSSDGIIYLFNEFECGYHSDLYPGHPGAINDMVAVTDNIVITGCEDGILRAVYLFPHRFIGQVGQHGGGLPSEKLDVNGQGNLIASTSLSNHVKFWDISYLENMKYAQTTKPATNKAKKKIKPTKNALLKEEEYQLPSSSKTNKGDFFKDMVDD